MKFDHLNIPVSSLERSRDWYVSTLGLKLEFEVPDRRTVALQDGEGFTITKSELDLKASVPGIDPDKFAEIAADAKANCPVSKVLNAEVTLTHTLT